MPENFNSCDVRAWREQVAIPTYAVGEPELNPCFLEKRVYQGSSGAVYPYPVIESVSNEKRLRTYDAIFLENQYLKIMILPELGGRVQMALDKTNDYHFVYYNRVIKPALVGLAGPWISGGIEFNWPQHHRPSTFHPVDAQIVQNDDGSSTVWCSEIDRMAGTKGMHGLTLHPDKAYLEVRVRLFNRTSLPQTFLWWANPAVQANDDHQSVFPPDVTAVMDHGKRDVSKFPIATGTYYKVDYSPGTDISRYRNIPVPTSFMAYRSDYDFVGSYDHGRQAGLLHVASHHIAPGKKQWTWGCGEFGRAWDRQLTDEDGPYVELMCGAFTDNQPDFSWLAPGEEKSFSQYFMPYKGVGLVKNATVDAAVGLERAGDIATVRVYATAIFLQARLVLHRGSTTLIDERVDLSPWAYREFSAVTSADATAPLNAAVYDQAGRKLVCYSPQPIDASVPASAIAIESPRALDSVEALYLAGVHLEQYRHPTRDPEGYYREGLRREPTDIRCNIGLGKLLLRRGLYSDATNVFRAAIRQATHHNPNPADGEAFYLLGLTLVAQGEHQLAESAFYKATWNAEQKAPAYFQLARLAMRRRQWLEARELLQECLANNQRHHQAIHLLVVALRHLGESAAAAELAAEGLGREPFNVGVRYEMENALPELCGDYQYACQSEHGLVELAHDYAHAGLYVDAAGVLTKYLESTHDRFHSAMTLYHAARYSQFASNTAPADALRKRASDVPRSGFFPHTLEDLAALEWVVTERDSDFRAWCDLGNLLYSKRRYEEAISCWERSAVGSDQQNLRRISRRRAAIWRSPISTSDAIISLRRHRSPKHSN
ncbi:DUF5107 domain-containing protein [Lacipirellula parvula]|uniref:DUF5107 domain-containing protein n=1 Tax=Lacipirellula parvula TaxID=2650471 RepID=A0A5K7XEN0_9BACT|nr:DUF5107 domain-containing protein [Lacipirellula parvula]BBO33331.1 hypothetical protein PLANPX_2943 [Lacipirellula parvula]